MKNSALNKAPLNPSRRDFVLSASAIAAAGFALGDTQLLAAQATAAGAPPEIKLFTSEALEGQIQTMKAAPANNTIVTDKNFTVILTVETAKSAPEFEYHEGRDHVLYILDGATVYVVGGTPKGAHSTKPGEWLAPESEGAVTYKLKKGDMLVLPRNTPHKRLTEGSVTLLLVSPMGVAKA
jgi:mannose-6-phosphate isomerase-like protein (cupin superfamily)